MSDLTGLRVAVVATDGFEGTELTEPVTALLDAGARVTIVALKPGHIQGVRQDLDKTIQVKVDRLISDVRADDFDTVHLPGGAVNADSLRTVPEVELVSAGLVRGRTLTSYHMIRDDVRN